MAVLEFSASLFSAASASQLPWPPKRRLATWNVVLLSSDMMWRAMLSCLSWPADFEGWLHGEVDARNVAKGTEERVLALHIGESCRR